MGLRSLPAPEPASLIDMTAGDDDLSDFYPEEPPAVESWVEFMFENNPAVVVFRELGYTRKKGREVLEAYAKKYPDKSNDELAPMFLKGLRAAATRKRTKAAAAEAAAAEAAAAEAAAAEAAAAEAEPMVDESAGLSWVEVIEQQGHLVTDQQGVDELPNANDFL
jgi:flavin-binding protein dodecin